MDDDGDLHEQILHIEAHIEELTDIIERCRKIILISKVAIAAGGILILAIIIGAARFDPTVLIGAIAAVIGGTVVCGSNTSTLKQTMTDMKAAEAHRTELISRMEEFLDAGTFHYNSDNDQSTATFDESDTPSLEKAVTVLKQCKKFWTCVKECDGYVSPHKGDATETLLRPQEHPRV